jgi:hypothetical protein
MFVLEKYDKITQTIDSAFQSEAENSEDKSFVTCIVKFSKGFIICSNTGEMALWVRSEENNSTSGKELYDFIRRWQPIATKNHSILSCSIGNDDILACCLDNNNIGIL